MPQALLRWGGRLRLTPDAGSAPMLKFAIERQKRHVGGFDVGRVLPAHDVRMVGPFIFFDHMGPETFPAGVSRDVDVRPHPHIGLSTVTYLFAGEIMHRDSLGNEQPIRPGEVNWMTAGSGITHSERFEKARREGGPLHGIQSWVALPDGIEETAPGFFHHDASALPALNTAGVRMRLIAGKAYGAASPVKVHSPMFYLHVEMDNGARLEFPDYPERAAYALSGIVETDGRRFREGECLIFEARQPATIQADAPASLMLFGGEPVGQRHIFWNFVSSSKERIEQAKADWKAGRMKLPDGDNQEFVPLPMGPPPIARLVE
jgi:redox-sensitive bicupin YhaK (pirin superfamily)